MHDQQHIESHSTRADGGRAILILLCAMVIASVLLFGAVDTGSMAVVALFSLIVVLIWIITSFKRGLLSISFDPIQLPLLALGFVGLIQLLPLNAVDVPPLLSSVAVSSLSLDPYATRLFLLQLFLFVVFFAAVLTFLNTAVRLRAVVITLVTFGSLLAFYSILQRVEQPTAIYGLREPDQAVPFGTYINRHHFAALMEMLLGLSLGILFSGKLKRNRWPFVIAAAVQMAIAVILTGSRGGMLGLLGVLVVPVAAANLRTADDDHGSDLSAGTGRLLTVIGASAFLLLAMGLALFVGGGDELFRSIGIEPGAGDISSGRIQFWQTGSKIFLAHPFIGAGFDAFGTAYTMFDPSSGAFRIEQAHNDYLQILSDAGIAGFICVAAFVYLLLKRSIDLIRNTAVGFRRGAAVGALAGCFGILIHSFFDFPLRTPANTFVFLALTAIATIDVADLPRRRHRRSSF
jgi:O-antigen ligase